MKKWPLLLIVCILAASVLISACEVKPDNSMVKAKRRLEKYLPKEETRQQKPDGGVDLSEGPKLRYDAKFGPKELDFDFKIVDYC